jgi:hypothetical protein
VNDAAELPDVGNFDELPDTAAPDPTDYATMHARNHAVNAVAFLITVMEDKTQLTADRLKAAQHILETAGCLSL